MKKLSTLNGTASASTVNAGGLHTVGLLSDGRVLSWGSNKYGQLADGTTTDRSTPVTVSGL
jgi:alpha-tubulin suppressor-like RCC1 family protein